MQGVNYLYNSPWYDFQRGFIKVGEVMSGNYYWGSSPYMTLTVNSTDADLTSMSNSLWSVIGHANTVYNNLKGASASQAVKNQCMGECLAWKAMAYFFLVRSFGDVPIIHDNSAMLADGSYSNVSRVEKADVYDYIIMTLEKAMELLPRKGDPGRIDYYAAEGLLAKVYLYRSGVKANGNGLRDAADLQKAARYAKDVIDNSGRTLMPNYSDVFRLQNALNRECLFSWLWTADTSIWTVQNTLQSDLAMQGFDEFGDCWGGYNGPSADLQAAFGVSPLEDPATRTEVDARRKATMMMAGDFYDYFWTDKTDRQGRKGFNFLQFLYDSNGYGSGGSGTLQSATGANCVKHLYGDASAIGAYYKVRSRAVRSAARPASITWEDVWKERRLELAMEGDRWYDFVRRSYYDMAGSIRELKQQKRGAYYGLNTLYKNYYESKAWNVDPSTMHYATETQAPNVSEQSFTLPFPSQDIVFNGNLQKGSVHVDVRSTYAY